MLMLIKERLKAMIDKNLISLVSRYDEAEEPLRKEEKYLIEVKNMRVIQMLLKKQS